MKPSPPSSARSPSPSKARFSRISDNANLYWQSSSSSIPWGKSGWLLLFRLHAIVGQAQPFFPLSISPIFCFKGEPREGRTYAENDSNLVLPLVSPSPPQKFDFILALLVRKRYHPCPLAFLNGVFILYCCVLHVFLDEKRAPQT